MRKTVFFIPVLVALMTACGTSSSSTVSDATAASNTVPPTSADVTTSASPVVTSSNSGGGGKTTVSTTTAPTTSVVSTTENVWKASPIDTTKLPIGTSRVSLSKMEIGGLFSCSAGNPQGGGASAVGPWMNEAAGTWNLSQKISVQGEVSWPMGTYSESVSGSVRVIKSYGLPIKQVTGVFPIASSDPAYAYDRNPNRIAAQTLNLSLPASPTQAKTATCLGKGSVGILKNGVSLFASLDEKNRDAVAYETQDQCEGHPQQSSLYHYHNVPSCILDASTASSTVVGFANDGFPIVVERDARGNLPTNADLDECHGRTSQVTLDGKKTDLYHYSATYEFPYFIGCFKGTPVS